MSRQVSVTEWTITVNTGDSWGVETDVCYRVDNNNVNTSGSWGVGTGVCYRVDNTSMNTGDNWGVGAGVCYSVDSSRAVSVTCIVAR